MIVEELAQKIFKEILRSSFSEKNKVSIVKDPYIFILDPYFNASYPLNKIGTWCRVVKNHLEAFVNIGQLIKILREQNRDLKEQFEREQYQTVVDSVEYALNMIGDYSYVPEWIRGGTRTRIEDLNKISNVYRKTNQTNAERLERFLFNNLNNKFIIIDLGCGTGGTIIPTLKLLERLITQGKIRKNYRNNLEVILIDISKEMLNISKKRLTGKIKLKDPKDNLDQPLSDRQIILKACNLRDLNKQLKEYRNKIDLIVSGATIIHSTDKDLIFSHLYDLLEPGGRANIWDLCAIQWTAPTVRVKEKNNSRTIYGIEGKNQKVILEKGQRLDSSIINYLENHKVEYVVNEIKKIEAERYIIYYSQFLIKQMGYGEELPKKIEKEMKAKLFSKEGFNFIDWLKENCVGQPIPLKEQSPYYFIEGSESPEIYAKAMKNTGFGRITSFVLADYYSKIGQKIEPTDKMVALVEGIKPQNEK